jgi:glycosyltransferase involved in cell wall biosynthesis
MHTVEASRPPRAVPHRDEAEKVLVAVERFPATGGSRVDKFVKLLPEHGIAPVVLSAKETDSPRARQLRQGLYPADLEAYQASSLGWSYFTPRYLVRAPGARNYRLLALLSLPERLLMLPDYMVRWIPPAIRLASEIVARGGIRSVLTSSPSESVHLIGLGLKQRFGIRWVADFRDLWTEKALLYRPPTRLHDVWTRRLEERVFTSADHIIANTPENAERYRTRFGLASDAVTVIPNGFDPDDLLGLHPHRNPRSKFRIGYCGSLDKHAFPWRLALDAVARFACTVGRDKVQLVHCGYASRQVREYIARERMEDLVVLHGDLPHEEAMKVTAETDARLLLLYENEYSTCVVPMKLYNYLIMDGPILAIAPEEGRTASILSETRMGVALSAARGVSTISGQLQHYYEAWEKGQLRVDPNRAEIHRYDRHGQVRKLAGILRNAIQHDGDQ